MKTFRHLLFIFLIPFVLLACEPPTLDETQSALLVGYWEQVQTSIITDTSEYVLPVEGVSLQLSDDQDFTFLFQPVHDDGQELRGSWSFSDSVITFVVEEMWRFTSTVDTAIPVTPVIDPFVANVIFLDEDAMIWASPVEDSTSSINHNIFRRL